MTLSTIGRRNSESAIGGKLLYFIIQCQHVAFYFLSVVFIFFLVLFLFCFCFCFFCFFCLFEYCSKTNESCQCTSSPIVRLSSSSHVIR